MKKKNVNLKCKQITKYYIYLKNIIIYEILNINIFTRKENATYFKY